MRARPVDKQGKVGTTQGKRSQNQGKTGTKEGTRSQKGEQQGKLGTKPGTRSQKGPDTWQNWDKTRQDPKKRECEKCSLGGKNAQKQGFLLTSAKRREPWETTLFLEEGAKLARKVAKQAKSGQTRHKRKHKQAKG